MSLTATVPMGTLQYLVGAPKFDHLIFQAVGPGAPRVFVAVKQNYSIAVMSLQPPAITASVLGVAAPQGLAISYPRGRNGILYGAGDDDGKLHAFDLLTFSQLWSLDLGGGADNVAMDERSGTIWCAFGDPSVAPKGGGLAAVNANTGALLGMISLPQHPEEFHLHPTASTIIGTCPDSNNLIYVADRLNFTVVAQYRIPNCVYPKANAPDWAHVRMFISCEALTSGAPGAAAQVQSGNPTFAVIDYLTGRLVWSTPTNYVCNTISFDSSEGMIYISCGGRRGIFASTAIVIKQSVDEQGVDSYAVLGSLPLPSSSIINARTSLFVESTQTLYIGQPYSPSDNQAGAVLVYAKSRKMSTQADSKQLSFGEGIAVGVGILSALVFILGLLYFFWTKFRQPRTTLIANPLVSLSSKPLANVPSLPAGWTKHQDASGDVWYAHDSGTLYLSNTLHQHQH